MTNALNLDVVKNQWSNLSDRDRLVFLIGLTVVVVYLFYILLYSPLQTAVVSKSKQWIEKKETLAWMKRQPSVKQPILKNDSNLLSAFSNELKHTPFSQFPYQLQQTGENGVQLSFDNVPYVECLTWLNALNREYQMTITGFNAVRSKTPGIVKMKIMVGGNRT